MNKYKYWILSILAVMAWVIFLLCLIAINEHPQQHTDPRVMLTNDIVEMRKDV